jgi:hypothetical protein
MTQYTQKDFATILAALELAASIVNCAEVDHFAKRSARLKGFVPDQRRINDVLALYKRN